MIKFLLLFLTFITLNATTIELDYADVNIEDFELSYFRDKNSSLDINAIKNMKFQSIHNEHAFNGKTGNVWYKIKFKNLTQEKKEIFLHNDFAYFLKSSTIFEFSKDHLVKQTFYNILEENSFNKLFGSSLIYQINIAPLDETTIYIKNTPMVSNIVNFNIYSSRASIDLLIHKDYFYTTIISIMLMLALYNFMLYFFNKREEFLYYFLYMITPTIGLMYKYGIIFSQFHLYGESTYLLNLTAIVMPGFLLLFVKKLLDIKALHKNINKTFNILLVLIALNFVIGVTVSLVVALSIFKLLFLPITVTIIYLMLYLKKISHPLALTFTVAYGFYFFGLIITILAMSGLIELNLFTFTSGGLGLIAEGITFSYLMHYNMKILEKEVLQQRAIIITKNKKAQLGDMISAITHQWKQPLNRITSLTAILEFKLSQKIAFKRNEIEDKIEHINENVQFLSTTIDDFKNFFNPNAKQELCDLQEIINIAIQLSSDDTLAKGITINQDLHFPKKTLVYKNELLHIIINILQNAKEAFTHHDEKIKMIKVIGRLSNGKIQIDIVDNAGGIDTDKLPFIFDENYTTKEDTKGTGLGLYLTKIILQEHLQGSLEVINIEGGTMFRIII